MTTLPEKANRRLWPRYIIFRDCQVTVGEANVDVTLLNVSRSGLAFLGPAIPVSPGDRLQVYIDGVLAPLTLIVGNVNYGRIGGRFDLEPVIATMWEEEFDQLIVGLSPM